MLKTWAKDAGKKIPLLLVVVFLCIYNATVIGLDFRQYLVKRHVIFAPIALKVRFPPLSLTKPGLKNLISTVI